MIHYYINDSKDYRGLIRYTNDGRVPSIESAFKGIRILRQINE